MGTRGLTEVYWQGQRRVSQYGQWDHYPSGQGITVLEFCREWLDGGEKEGRFLSNLAIVRFKNEDDQARADEFAKSIGIVNGLMNGEQWERWNATYPYWTRNHGAKILSLIAEPLPGHDLVLRDSHDFAGDSVFCEYAYVLDLDARHIEVYGGFNKSPAKGRYADLPGRHDYQPVTLLAMFALSDLPSKEAFLARLEPEDADV